MCFICNYIVKTPIEVGTFSQNCDPEKCFASFFYMEFKIKPVWTFIEVFAICKLFSIIRTCLLPKNETKIMRCEIVNERGDLLYMFPGCVYDNHPYSGSFLYPFRI